MNIATKNYTIMELIFLSLLYKQKERQGLLPADVAFIPCRSVLHLQFLLLYYEYYSSSAPTTSYRLI